MRKFSPALAALAALAVLAPAAQAQPAAAPEPAAQAERTPSPPGAYLYIGWPNDGERVMSPFKVWFGLRNMGVAPAEIERAGTGHHHLIVDADLPPMDEPIPNNQHYRHFGGGQTETMLDLSPGRHTLQLIMGDYDHVPHDPPVISKRITITVD